MGGFTVRNLITLTRSQNKALAVRESGFEFAFETEQYVSFRTPMICQVAGRVLDDTNANLAEFLRAPKSDASLPGVLGRHNLSPVRGGEWKPDHFHGSSMPEVRSRGIT